MPNPVVWFEILGKDGEQLKEFYKNLFDWKVVSDNPINYGIVAQEQGGIGGGIMGEQESTGVCIYAAVPDLQACLDKAVALGGTVVTPITEVPGMVIFAQFRDPAGNLFGIVKDSM